MDYERFSDEELCQLSATDELAREAIIKRYKHAVISVARSYFLNGGDEEDLVSEGMFGVFKAVSTYNGKSPFRTYAYLCIKTNILTAIKKSASKKNLPMKNYLSLSGDSEGDADKTEVISDKNFNPEDMLIKREAEAELKDAILACLSKMEKEIFRLYLSGYSYSEISDFTNKNVKSVGNAVQRIRKKTEAVYKQIIQGE